MKYMKMGSTHDDIRLDQSSERTRVVGELTWRVWRCCSWFLERGGEERREKQCELEVSTSGKKGLLRAHQALVPSVGY